MRNEGCGTELNLRATIPLTKAADSAHVNVTKPLIGAAKCQPFLN